VYALFTPLGKLADHAIYFACINLKKKFLMIARRTIISGSTGPMFKIISPNESVLGADDRSGPFFPISQAMLLWQPISWKNSKFPSFVVVAFRNTMGYCYVNVHIYSVNDASISCKNIVNFGPATAELTELFCELLVLHGKNWHIQLNIS